MLPDKRQELADRLAEIREQLETINTGAGGVDVACRNRDQRLYAEMVSLERRLFASHHDG